MARYRVRVSFTMWRLMAAMACFCVVMGLIHDAEYTEPDDIGWTLIIVSVFFYGLFGIWITTWLCKRVYARYLMRSRREEPAASGVPSDELASHELPRPYAHPPLQPHDTPDTLL